MFSRNENILVVAGLCIGLVGCDEAVEQTHLGTPVDDDVTFRKVVDNGVEINGPLMNGMRMNGMRMNGMRMNGMRMNGMRMNTSELESFAVTAGSLITALLDSIQRSGADLVDAEYDFDYEITPGSYEHKKLRIAGVVQSSTDPDIYFNDVRYQVDEVTWDYLCRDGASNPTEAIALNFAWDESTGSRLEYPDAFTWACRGAALAKAVEWGYAPWRSAGATSLKDAHQAAVRMIRADYCGTGVTHTVNGNPIDVSDKWSIQVPGTAWPVEAKWGPDGAVCLNTPRRQSWSRATVIAECVAAGKGVLPTCTNSSPTEFGGLLMTQANAL
ncbi:ADYC domain-containing protein [Nannocystis punicea]|uniref:ADYC domain-containing protein n=1 Tax=Nannocystis punicea TaxID=2995304 RepID=A0ABY7H4K3_9BACT|nr:ADYC domain-containing protein [Nannocystis poenicansa]WAS93909.1 ADYC domain-containing protein [Nannocystis poenicansa]